VSRWQGQLIGVTCVLVAVVMQGVGQICFKWAATRAARDGSSSWRGRARRSRHVLVLGMSCYIVQATFWTLALRRLDISVAFPLGSLSFVAVAVLSSLILGEVVGGKRWVGIALILTGAALLGAGV
jgi:undecaprenyl phosphate-alpha-L-ara4N flippase subunit ArnE